MGFVGEDSDFESLLYNPSLYESSGSGLSRSLADRLYVGVSDIRLTYTDGITVGTASANKALVVDSNRNIDNIGELRCTGLLVNGGNVASNTDIGYITNITPGTASADKALVIDSNLDISGINSLSSTTISGTMILTPDDKIVSPGITSSNCLWHSSMDRYFGMRQPNSNEFVLLAYSESGAYNDKIKWTHNAVWDLEISGDMQANNINATGSFYINGTAISASASELNVLDGITAGTASASKALLVDANRDITNINSLTASSINANLTGTIQTAAQPNITSIGTLTSIATSGDLTIGSTVISETDIAKIDDITDGTASANKALVLNSSRNIININDITASQFKLNANSGMSFSDNRVVIAESGEDCLYISNGGLVIGPARNENESIVASSGDLTVNGSIIARDAIDTSELLLDGNSVLNLDDSNLMVVKRVRMNNASSDASMILWSPITAEDQNNAYYWARDVGSMGGQILRSNIFPTSFINDYFGVNRIIITRFCAWLNNNTTTDTGPFRLIKEKSAVSDFKYNMIIDTRDNGVFNQYSIGLNTQDNSQGAGNKASHIHIDYENSNIMLMNATNMYLFNSVPDWSNLNTDFELCLTGDQWISGRLSVGDPFTGSGQLSVMNSSLPDNDFFTAIRVGKQNASKSSFSISYHHTASNSDSNRISFQCSGRNNDFNIHGNGNCSIRGSSNLCPLTINASTSFTVNPTNDPLFSYNRLLTTGVEGQTTGSSRTTSASIICSQAIICDQLIVTSDRRVKSDIIDYELEDAITLLNRCQPKWYNKLDDSGNKKSEFGLIAQDLGIDSTLIGATPKEGLEGDKDSPADMLYHVDYSRLTVMNLTIIKHLLREFGKLKMDYEELHSEYYEFKRSVLFNDS